MGVLRGRGAGESRPGATDGTDGTGGRPARADSTIARTCGDMAADIDCERSVTLRFRWNGRVFADSEDRRPEGPLWAEDEPIWGSSTRVEEAGDVLTPTACAEARAVSSWRGYGRDEEEDGKLAWLIAYSALAAGPDETDKRDRMLLGVDSR